MYKGKILVTGGSRGIGNEVKKAGWGWGFDTIAPTRNELDVTSAKSWEWLIEEHGATFTMIVHCAADATGEVIDDEKDTFEDFTKMSRAAWLVLRNARRLVRDGGNIILLTSVVAKRGAGNAAAYQAAKAAISQMVRNSAIHYAPDIRVNAICPGFIATDLTAPYHTNEKYKKFVDDHTPLRRMGHTHDIVKAVSLLLGNSFMTGAEVVVDGGWLA